MRHLLSVGSLSKIAEFLVANGRTRKTLVNSRRCETHGTLPIRCVIPMCMALIAPSSATFADGPLTLWYDEPAEVWTDALPVGNGSLGGMIYGGVEEEQIQFNEDTLWAGGPRSYAREGAVEHLDEIRALLLEGSRQSQKQAEELAMETFMSEPLRQLPYQPFGDVRITFEDYEEATGYRRELDLNTAVTTVDYAVGETTYRREIFSSYPDQVMVVRMTADGPKRLAFTATLKSPHEDSDVRANGSMVILQGAIGEWDLGDNIMIPGTLTFEAQLAVDQSGGTLETIGGAISVKGAKSVTLILAAATSFVDYKTVDGNPSERCAAKLAGVKGKSYDALLQNHLADYEPLFKRVSIDLGPSVDAPTDERIRDFASSQDPGLAALLFQYGRYLLIASSRPGSQPTNLQGIWNDDLRPPWDSKYTCNINTQMNYWPAEVTHLPECTEPLFSTLEELAESGAITAREYYGADGWVLHHNFDLWRGTAPINHSNHGIWPTGGAWLCQHLWWHYVYNLDRTFLAETAYPL
ncbi:MAG: glycoside hydrolase family 95 protein, partial [Candidatus Omnitrophica bacterium]|nr:glycoside hydrolase family 95 protein [Candidatus Omnitrophota bacterium]